MGRVESELGRWEQAGDAYRESLALSRRLARDIGETPQALRDLSISLNNVASVERTLERLWLARQALEGSLGERLLREAGRTPRTFDDVASTRTQLAAVAAAASDHAQEIAQLQQALALAQVAAAAAPLWTVPHQREARIRRHLADLASAQANSPTTES